MNDTASIIAEHLLHIKAVKLSPDRPFTWASGWLSPIYCDNRKILSYPETREIVKNAFVKLIREEFPGTGMIAGIATGAIAHGSLVADALNLPFIYVRSEPKNHGLENLIEGEIMPGKQVIVIEDLISTGGSSIKAVHALRKAGLNVTALIAIFSYQFEIAASNFLDADCHYLSLCNYDTLIDTALAINYIKKEDLEILKQWRQDPSHWTI
ncbi:MAG: orotate phosphoribosyltransferase [Bacteroidia bacterium]|nr:orotate phosphoribosyltransferase [Bacteroidia bacterium]